MGRVLIVENIGKNLKIRSKLIRAQYPEFSVEGAKSACEAIAFINSQDIYDLVITDMHMPPTDAHDNQELKKRGVESGQEGLEVIKVAREKDVYTEILVYTAKGDWDNARMALELGANQYLHKSLDVEGNPSTTERLLLQWIQKRMIRVKMLRRHFAMIEALPGYAALEKEIPAQQFLQYARMLHTKSDICEELAVNIGHISIMIKQLRASGQDKLIEDLKLQETYQSSEKILHWIRPLIEALQ